MTSPEFLIPDSLASASRVPETPKPDSLSPASSCPYLASDFTSRRLDLDPVYARLRDEQPVSRVTMPHGGDAWLVTRYDDVRAALADPRLSRAATVGKDVPRSSPLIQHPESLLSMDPPEHTRLRRLAAKAFSVRQVEAVRPRVQAIVDGLVDALEETGSPADLAGGLAWPMGITVICETFGVPEEDRAAFRAWTDTMMALTVADPTGIQAARAELDSYLRDLIARRIAEPGDDLLSRLVTARDGRDRLTEAELAIFAVDLLTAGHETTANQTGNFLYTLLSRPALWDSLVEDPGLVPGAVEELLRVTPLATSVAPFSRIAVEDLEIGGVLVRAGDAVVAQNDSANRDGTVFERPEEIDFTRAVNPHLAFGHGAHHCPAAPLARLELRTAVATLVRRLPGLRLAVPVDEVVWQSNRVMRGVKELPVKW
ncbi:cytochrome P450 [Streptomyces hydrogenans]|uniref:cytochrome P450 n=1 Tax=Streptomyces hydrogenans TaxID=1873719 RepID=UPI0037FDF246